MPLRQRAARAGLEAHVRFTVEQHLRFAAMDLRVIGLDTDAEALRRMARNLGAQRRRLMAKAGV